VAVAAQRGSCSLADLRSRACGPSACGPSACGPSACGPSSARKLSPAATVRAAHSDITLISRCPLPARASPVDKDLPPDPAGPLYAHLRPLYGSGDQQCARRSSGDVGAAELACGPLDGALGSLEALPGSTPVEVLPERTTAEPKHCARGAQPKHCARGAQPKHYGRGAQPKHCARDVPRKHYGRCTRGAQPKHSCRLARDAPWKHYGRAGSTALEALKTLPGSTPAGSLEATEPKHCARGARGATWKHCGRDARLPGSTTASVEALRPASPLRPRRSRRSLATPPRRSRRSLEALRPRRRGVARGSTSVEHIS